MHVYIHKNIIYPDIHKKIHELEELLASIVNTSDDIEVNTAIEQAHDLLVHQVAEYVRTAESRLTHT